MWNVFPFCFYGPTPGGVETGRVGAKELASSQLWQEANIFTASAWLCLVKLGAVLISQLSEFVKTIFEGWIMILRTGYIPNYIVK
jgi:hypothetical protein